MMKKGRYELSLLCTPITHALLDNRDGNLHLFMPLCASVVSVVTINYQGAAFQKEVVHC